MQRNFASLLAAGVLVATVARLQAQDPTADAARYLRGGASPISRSTGVAEFAGGFIGGGRSYEARFTPGSMEFVPVLGERAPRTLPLRFSMTSVRRGDTVVFDAGTDQPKPVRNGATVSFARGKSVVERYDVRIDGVEQSFAFTEPMAGRGDLVVTGRIDTELVPQALANGGIWFRSAGVGGVSFGAVTGIDADGRRIAGSLRTAGSALELVLPGSFVDEARFPLVLDPLIGTQFEANGTVGSGFDDSESDVAYDATSGNYLVTWRRKFSATNSLIRGQRLDSTGALVGTTHFFVPSSSALQNHARVANVNLRDRFLVVWAESPFIVGPRDIYGTTIDAAAGTQSTVVALANTGDDEFNPCVASEATTGDDEALLVWEDNANGILARQVTLPAAGDPVAAGSTAIMGTILSNDPCVSKSGGSTGRLVIGWTNANLLGDSEIAVQGITKDAVLIGSTVAVTANTVNDSAPAVDGDGNNFVVVWQQIETGGSTHDINARRMTLSTTALTLNGSETTIDGIANTNDVSPDIAFLTAGKFGVFWVTEISTFLDDIRGHIVNLDCSTCGNGFALGGINNPGHNREFEPRCVGQRSGSTAAGDAGMLVFSEGADTPPFESDIIAQRFEAIGPGTAPVVAGPGCGAGGTAGISSPFVVGNPNFAFRLTGVSASSLLFLSIAFPGPTLAPCGTCVLTNPIAFDFIGNVGGSGTKPYPTSCDPIYLGLTLEFQWVLFNTASNPCPTTPSLAASQRLRITLGQ